MDGEVTFDMAGFPRSAVSQLRALHFGRLDSIHGLRLSSVHFNFAYHYRNRAIL